MAKPLYGNLINIAVIAAFLLIPLMIGLAIWYEVAVWRECLTDHSWWYCLRIIGK